VTASVRKDGVIDFKAHSCLLSIDTITRAAVDMFVRDTEKSLRIQREWAARNRVAELRKSCGVEPERMTIRFNIGIRRADGEADHQSA
jgi:hypothetical protein